MQWRLTCDLNTLWQRFGRAACDPMLWAVAVLLVEPKFFDEEKEKAKTRVEKRAVKRMAAELTKEGPSKRARTVTAQTAAPPASAAQSSSVDAVPVSNQDLERSVESAAEGNDEAETEASRGISQEQAPSGMSELNVAPTPARVIDIAALRADIEAARVVQTSVKKKGPKKAQDTGELAPELDALINAVTRPFRCYRTPITAFYGNDRIGRYGLVLWVRILTACLVEPDSHLCRPAGCSHCAARPSPVCCILCSPNSPLLPL